MNNVAHRTVKPPRVLCTPRLLSGDPSRVDATPAAVSAGRSDLRLLSGDAFSVLLRDQKTYRIMKKEYMKPTMRVIRIQHQHQILAGSPGTEVYGTTMSGSAQMSRSFDGWDDDCGED